MVSSPKIIEGLDLAVSPLVSPQWFEVTDRGSFQEKQAPERENSPLLEGCVASSFEHVYIFLGKR